MTRTVGLIALSAAAGLVWWHRRRQVAQPPGGLVFASFDAQPLPVAIPTAPEREPEPGTSLVIDLAARAWGAVAGWFDPVEVIGVHFQRFDFGAWPMAPRLVALLNEFATRIEAIGGRVFVSPAAGAVGRHDGVSGTSQHNVDRWGEVRAVDVMLTGVALRTAADIAAAVGFHGIGAYPDWLPSPGLHLDVRADRTAANPATWSGRKVNGVQVTSLPLERAWT